MHQAYESVTLVYMHHLDTPKMNLAPDCKIHNCVHRICFKMKGVNMQKLPIKCQRILVVKNDLSIKILKSYIEECLSHNVTTRNITTELVAVSQRSFLLQNNKRTKPKADLHTCIYTLSYNYVNHTEVLLNKTRCNVRNIFKLSASNMYVYNLIVG